MREGLLAQWFKSKTTTSLLCHRWIGPLIKVHRKQPCPRRSLRRARINPVPLSPQILHRKSVRISSHRKINRRKRVHFYWKGRSSHLWEQLAKHARASSESSQAKTPKPSQRRNMASSNLRAWRSLAAVFRERSISKWSKALRFKGCLTWTVASLRARSTCKSNLASQLICRRS